MDRFESKKHHITDKNRSSAFEKMFFNIKKSNIHIISHIFKTLKRYLIPAFLFPLFAVSSFSQEIITPLTEIDDYNKEKALLGKMLFFDPRLSKDGTVSCASCHDLENGGDDGLSVSVGVEGKKGNINAPTVLNSRYNFVQFWDGRAKDLKEQVPGPVQNPVEMGSDFEDIVKKLNKDKFYVKEFTKLYKEPISREHIIDAIAEFEKALVTPSRFDAYLLGDKDILTEEEIEGYELFKSYGCISCHNGKNIGGNLYQKLGIVIPENTQKWEGRFAVTKNKEDLHYFKVPTLRNISKTAPYFHEGDVKTLEETINIMAYYQLGITLTKDQINKIKAFLKSLDGDKLKIMDQQ